MSAPRTDPTGLHAEDCECQTCETGFRPTELERSAAQRALEARGYFERKRRQRLAGVQLPLAPARRQPLPCYKLPPPYTEEQKAELEKMRREFHGTQGPTHKRS